MSLPRARSIVVTLALLLGGCGDPDFESASRANSPAAFEEYLQAHPDGAHAREARERLAELSDHRDWEQAHAAATAESYQKYLRTYPQGAHTHEALIAIANLNLSAPAPPPASATAPAAVAAPAARAPAVAAVPADPATAPAVPVASPRAAPQATATPPVAAPVPKKPAVAASGTYRVQLGAYGENRAAAERGWKVLLARHPALAARTPDIVAARDAAGRSIQRLQVAGFSKSEAESFCHDTLAGDPCLVVPPAPPAK
jgi:hypothetical protein